jgi:hypothetical protein
MAMKKFANQGIPKQKKKTTTLARPSKVKSGFKKSKSQPPRDKWL